MTKKHHPHEHTESQEDATKPKAEASSAEDLALQLASYQEAAASYEEKAKANWEKFIRVTADMENVRKRAKRDIDTARKFALEEFMKELIPVLDSLEQGLLVTTQSDGIDAAVASLYEGMQLIQKQLLAVVEKFGLVALMPIGETFDPHLHEAMLMQPGSGEASGVVLTVVQKGYQLNGRLVRPARVIVAQ